LQGQGRILLYGQRPAHGLVVVAAAAATSEMQIESHAVQQQ
jgi:hypothetical protein